jgi:hypothetical protein
MKLFEMHGKPLLMADLRPEEPKIGGESTFGGSNFKPMLRFVIVLNFDARPPKIETKRRRLKLGQVQNVIF